MSPHGEGKSTCPPGPDSESFQHRLNGKVHRFLKRRVLIVRKTLDMENPSFQPALQFSVSFSHQHLQISTVILFSIAFSSCTSHSSICSGRLWSSYISITTILHYTNHHNDKYVSSIGPNQHPLNSVALQALVASSHPLAPPNTAPAAPTAIPALVYRVHHASAQTRYHFSTGFSAKNQTTILNHTLALSRFGLAHLNQQTNISSPFISVYDNLAHAENVAKYFATKYGEDAYVVTVDTRHFARGPVFRAADLLKGGQGRERDEWLHWGEYLVMYRIPAQAIRDQTPVARGSDQKWRTVGVIGGP